ncbi:MAG: NADH-quinone oxidoreductase subunit L [Syntrophomonadaceae bacterium]|jgi:NADH-quinone oxidoreductase subunit L|nr:NADH-quinone oxidoreductase subunit L [Syntrophomonadaceae bacterium]
MADILNYIWLIPVLPFLAFAAAGTVFIGKPATAAAVSIFAIAISFIISIITAVLVFTSAPGFIYESSLRWLDMPGLRVEMGLLIDPLSALMLLVVTTVALLVQIYSLGYMRDDPGFARYFAYQSVFAGSMLGLVLANNFGQIYVFWELVGLCSYLLIGFWYHKDSAKNAAIKAFITNRIGDFGFLLGILLLLITFGTLSFSQLPNQIGQYSNAAMLLVIGLLLFLGPMGKSAQFPLHVWLPDAMEGPTPVSALIHAATMVAAGVYLIARAFFIFSESAQVMSVIAYVGGFTALFAATIAITQNDIKRILAFSTLSQLGYMVMAMGIGAMTAGMFHLTTHAFFKALLFLGAGSVIHALHDEQDIWKMGNLSGKMPVTTVTFIIGALALAGIPPLAGFWSKDEILSGAFAGSHTILYLLGVFVAFLTAFYMFRLIFVAFFGSNHGGLHAHESPAPMTIPLIILSVFAIGAGLVNTGLTDFAFSRYITVSGLEHHEPVSAVMIISSLVAAAGIFLAWLIYQKQIISAEAIKTKFIPIYNLLQNKYYIDEIYAWAGKNLVLGSSRLFEWLDLKVVNGIVDGLAGFARWSGSKLRLLQNGQIQTYTVYIYVGLIVLLLAAICMSVNAWLI